tara:strand:- start:1939 stop:2133 length:195 start_codon:yes stop_codon:yes gene_type:complete
MPRKALAIVLALGGLVGLTVLIVLALLPLLLLIAAGRLVDPSTPSAAPGDSVIHLDAARRRYRL